MNIIVKKFFLLNYIYIYIVYLIYLIWNIQKWIIFVSNNQKLLKYKIISRHKINKIFL